LECYQVGFEQRGNEEAQRDGDQQRMPFMFETLQALHDQYDLAPQ